MRWRNTARIMATNNPIIAELQALAELPCRAGQHAFFERRYRDARPVDCVPMADVFTPEQLDFLKQSYRPERKQCYKNASDLVQLISHPWAFLFDGPVKYVEGYACSNGLFPIEHAFVKVGDKYIDPTFEIVLGMDVKSCHYVSLIEMEYRDLAEILLENEYYGDIYRTVYIRGLQGRKKAKADG